ncbi:pseudouridine synthase [Hippea sp. KM1]|uniref:pseudouridine synthase n=1 Tax=Hippea sp. KM1 TaxID=944481 RepID=UPI00046D38D5|nr:pseudouridine synthase [Hippea sp. KM1]
MRINKYLAEALKISRRKADEYVKNRRVKVNGKTINGFIDVKETDVIEVDGEVLSLDKERLYFAFNKPPFVISSTSDEENRKTVCDFFEGIDKKLICVGRLDYLSEGLLIVTNDGDFANMLMHPRFKIKKTYLIKTARRLSEEELENLRRGATLEDGFFKPLKVQRTNNDRWILISINTGRNRIIRRFLKRFDIKIEKLKRIAIGNIELGNLKKGSYRKLTQEELSSIRKLTNGQRLN